MKYIAMTLGPIVDTLVLGRKTSEIWMASYLFSSFMKNTIYAIKARKGVKFIIPYVEDDSIFVEKDDGIGMFHDRFILQSDTLSLEDVHGVLQDQKDALSKMVAKSIKKDERKVKIFFDQYLQTYLFESDEGFDDPIIDISDILDSVELHTPRLETDEDYLRLFLNRDVVLGSDLARKAFGRRPSFDSVEAIAMQELDKDLEAKNAYKYIAIIHEDGDNLGSYIKQQRDVSTVSKRLFEFDKKAVDTIKVHGAIPLFIGGDDLLIFAPVLNEKRTVLDLVADLSKDYKDTLETDESTLSFGISITYYKYPLYEALEKSREALFEIAKKHEGKNAIAISAQKHSGSSFDFCIGKDTEVYRHFSTLLNSVLTNNVELPHAVHHKLQEHQKVFENIDPVRLSATLENMFNEDLHKSKFKVGLEQLQSLMQGLGLDEDAQRQLFAMLSTIKLMRGDR